MKTEVLVQEACQSEHNRAVSRDSVNRGTVVGRALRLERDGMGELRRPGCLPNRRPSGTHCSILLPELSGGPPDVGCVACLLSNNTRWMVGGHHVLVVVANRRDGTSGFVLSVWTLEGQGVSSSPTVMNTLLAKIHTVFLPELPEGLLGV